MIKEKNEKENQWKPQENGEILQQTFFFLCTNNK
jgi:hypothetical protein